MALSSLTPWDLCGNRPVSRRRGDGEKDAALGHVVVGEEARARDEAVRAGGRAGADGLRRRFDAAVDLCGNQPVLAPSSGEEPISPRHRASELLISTPPSTSMSTSKFRSTIHLRIFSILSVIVGM